MHRLLLFLLGLPSLVQAKSPAITGDCSDPALLAAQCNRGDGDACSDLGCAVKANDEARAVALYRRGCDAGSQRACANFGWALEAGHSIVADPPRAAQLYERA